MMCSGIPTIKNVKPSSILTMAREYVSGGWTKGEYARDKNGIRVSPESACACSFCMVGAIRRASVVLGASDSERDKVYPFVSKVIQHQFRWYDHIHMFQDEERRKKSEVITVFDLAISMALEVEHG